MPQDPDHIHLPNGSRHNIQELLKQAQRNTKRINLRTGRTHAARRRPQNTRYDEAERRWQAEAELLDIQQRYNINEAQARCLRWQAQQICRLLDSE